jgi:hypothetical protein
MANMSYHQNDVSDRKETSRLDHDHDLLAQVMSSQTVGPAYTNPNSYGENDNFIQEAYVGNQNFDLPNSFSFDSFSHLPPHVNSSYSHYPPYESAEMRRAHRPYTMNQDVDMPSAYANTRYAPMDYNNQFMAREHDPLDTARPRKCYQNFEPEYSNENYYNSPQINPYARYSKNDFVKMRNGDLYLSYDDDMPVASMFNKNHDSHFDDSYSPSHHRARCSSGRNSGQLERPIRHPAQQYSTNEFLEPRNTHRLVRNNFYAENNNKKNSANSHRPQSQMKTHSNLPTQKTVPNLNLRHGPQQAPCFNTDFPEIGNNRLTQREIAEYRQNLASKQLNLNTHRHHHLPQFMQQPQFMPSNYEVNPYFKTPLANTPPFINEFYSMPPPAQPLALPSSLGYHNVQDTRQQPSTNAYFSPDKTRDFNHSRPSSRLMGPDRKPSVSFRNPKQKHVIDCEVTSQRQNSRPRMVEPVVEKSRLIKPSDPVLYPHHVGKAKANHLQRQTSNNHYERAKVLNKLDGLDEMSDAKQPTLHTGPVHSHPKFSQNHVPIEHGLPMSPMETNVQHSRSMSSSRRKS